jgi:hypothetical protein
MVCHHVMMADEDAAENEKRFTYQVIHRRDGSCYQSPARSRKLGHRYHSCSFSTYKESGQCSKIGKMPLGMKYTTTSAVHR